MRSSEASEVVDIHNATTDTRKSDKQNTTQEY